MQELQIFKNADFGEIRMLEKNGKILFCGSDAARALGYVNTKDALQKHCLEDGVAFCDLIDNIGRKQKAKFISEGNLYRLIVHSKLPKAEQFEKWVFDEVLPEIRKTGAYINQRDKQMLDSINTMAKIIRKTYKEAGVEPKFTAIAINNLYKEQTGIFLPLPITVEEEKLYDCTEIAKELKIFSDKDKPHQKAVSAIIQKLNVDKNLVVKTPFTRNGHSDFTIQYKPMVFEKIKYWLNENKYPTCIIFTDKNGNKINCKVKYGQ